MIRAIYFDIGETILDRTREYGAWAKWLDVPAHTFSAVFGAMIAAGHPVRDVIARFRPEPDFFRQHESLVSSGLLPELAEQDLYQDARATLAALTEAGYRVGIVGNQPAAISAQLRDLHLAADLVASSQEWGIAKPSREFFDRIVGDAGFPAASVAYVGDQLGNDIVPALAAGLPAIRVRTGPWGQLLKDDEVEARCFAVVDHLAEIVPLLEACEERPDHRRR
jgi:FMN phosphatase YigB (HAD superfamily)